MSNPRIEEVSDSDPEIDDPQDFLPNEIMRRTDAPAAREASGTSGSNPTLLRQPPAMSQIKDPSEFEIRAKRAELKPYITIYPIYFDASRTRQGGRRVSSKLAVQNPLAFNILKAASYVLGNEVKMGFEPDKIHPKDWSNPGRVKIQLFDKDHKPLHRIDKKQHLYNLIAKELQKSPTVAEDPLDLRIQGVPIPENWKDSEVAVPRGWKMGKILPIHSPAVTGGGVSDNFFKDAMEEMKAMGQSGGAGPGGMDMGAMAQMMQNMGGMGGMGGNAGPSTSSKKKDKKK